MFPRPRSIIKFPDSARNRNPEEYKGTVFYRTFVLLAPFYNSGTRCILFYIGLKYFIGLACFGKFMQVLSILIQFKYF